MTQNRSRGRSLTLLAALLTLGLGAGPVLAAGPGHGYGHGHRSHDHGYGYDYPSAGWITIDGYRTHIEGGPGKLARIARAFRESGYKARVYDGVLRVEAGYHKPRIYWSAGVYDARLRWKGYGLTMKLHPAYSPAYKPDYGKRLRPKRVRRAFHRPYRSYSTGICVYGG